MAAATAAEAPPQEVSSFPFSAGKGAADDFRQASEQPEGHFVATAGVASSTTVITHVLPAGASETTAVSAVDSVDAAVVRTTCATATSAAPASAAAAAANAPAPAAGVASAALLDTVAPPAPAATTLPGAASATAPAAAASSPLPVAVAAAAPAVAAANSSPGAAASASASAADAASAAPALPLTPGETALLEYRKLGRKYLNRGLTNLCFPNMEEEDLDQFGWQEALQITAEPHPCTLPVEALSHKPTLDEIHKFFFKGTPREVCIRQVFFHTPLSVDEQQWLQQFRRKCAASNWAIPFFLEPHVFRIVWFCKRKYPEDAINKSLEHAQLMVDWRRQFYPICDAEAELRKLLDMGVMYWVGRDASLRPLLIVRLSRLPKTTSPELFKRLTIFCFEWSLRFLMVPGAVETCVVLFDVRTVPLHQFPISALTDMVTTLTRQFPFRLHRMWIINDSFFVQTAWNIVKQFLTDVQQQKIQFYRTGFETELLKEYEPHQLEKHYGGTRELTKFYPFPVASGPFTATGTSPLRQPLAVPPWKASDRFTAFGVVWENSCRVPLQWTESGAAAEVFRLAGLPPPPPPVTLEDKKMAKALELVEKTTFAQRTSCIRSYKSLAQRLSSAAGGKSSRVWRGSALGGDLRSSPRGARSSVSGMEEHYRENGEALGVVGTGKSERLSTVACAAVVTDNMSPPTIAAQGSSIAVAAGPAIGTAGDAAAAAAAAGKGDAAAAAEYFAGGEGGGQVSNKTVADASGDSSGRARHSGKTTTADAMTASATAYPITCKSASIGETALPEGRGHEDISTGRTAQTQPQIEGAGGIKQRSKEASVAARTSGFDAPQVEKVRSRRCCRKC